MGGEMAEYLANKTCTVPMLGAKLTLLGTEQLLENIEHLILAGKQGAIVASGNVHSFNIAAENDWYRDFLLNSDIVRLDGAGVSVAARLLGYKPPPRSTWADFGWDLAEFCEKKGFSLFLFGNKPGVSDDAATCLKKRFPALKIIGTQHGYIDLRIDSQENRKFIKTIETLAPDIFIVGLGMPLQERWISENITRLKARVIMTGGAVFEYISCKVPRAPDWMRNNGLEWLFRLTVEPKRMWRRYLIGNPLFFMRVIRLMLCKS
jgi:N-acetylglucosaminyldiphosphoundecaprenol N-acetyl-beta-D-mannosaminyltransferase